MAHSTRERCGLCDTLLYKGSCLDCVPPAAVKAYILSCTTNAMCKAVARNVTDVVIGSYLDDWSEMEENMLARHVDTIAHEMPGVYLQLPTCLQMFRALHSVPVMNALAEERTGREQSTTVAPTDTEAHNMDDITADDIMDALGFGADTTASEHEPLTGDAVGLGTDTATSEHQSLTGDAVGLGADTAASEHQSLAGDADSVAPDRDDKGVETVDLGCGVSMQLLPSEFVCEIRNGHALNAAQFFTIVEGNNSLKKVHWLLVSVPEVDAIDIARKLQQQLADTNAKFDAVDGHALIYKPSFSTKFQRLLCTEPGIILSRPKTPAKQGSTIHYGKLYVSIFAFVFQYSPFSFLNSPFKSRQITINQKSLLFSSPIGHILVAAPKLLLRICSISSARIGSWTKALLRQRSTSGRLFSISRLPKGSM